MDLTVRERIDAAENFYRTALEQLLESGVPFLIGGAYAMREYAEIFRDTKDLDIFCTAGDYPRILECLGSHGYETEITDASWLAKAFCGDHFVDLIFNSGNGLCPVDESWFERARSVELFGLEVRLISSEEEIWTKLYIRDRHRFDGADVCHILRKQAPHLDWRHLLTRVEPHWEIFLAELLEFRFVYPSQRDTVPRWIMEELLSRARHQLDLPEPKDRICRGPMLSRTDYEIDIREWEYRSK